MLLTPIWTTSFFLPGMFINKIKEKGTNQTVPLILTAIEEFFDVF